MQYNTTHALIIQKGVCSVEKFSAGGEKVPGKPNKSLSTTKLMRLNKSNLDSKSVINLNT